MKCAILLKIVASVKHELESKRDVYTVCERKVK